MCCRSGTRCARGLIGPRGGLASPDGELGRYAREVSLRLLEKIVMRDMASKAGRNLLTQRREAAKKDEDTEALGTPLILLVFFFAVVTL